MNDQRDDFERKARARLQAELSRVPVPQGRPRRVRPRQAAGWGGRLVGATALLALLALLAAIGAGSIRVPEQTAQADPTVQIAPALPDHADATFHVSPAQPSLPPPPVERLYLLNTVGVVVDGEMTTGGGRIRAFDPVTQSDVWTREHPADAPPPSASQPTLAPSGGLGEVNGATPYWIDGALAPDGKTLYVVEPFLISALDTATGEELWRRATTAIEQAGERPVLTVAADGKTLYLPQMWSKAGETLRWLHQADAQTGENRGRIDLPARTGPGRLIAYPDQTSLFYVTHEQVLKISDYQVDSTILTIASGIRDAALTPDGRTLLLLNGANELISYDTASATVNPRGIALGIASNRSSVAGRLLLSPSGDRLVVQGIEEMGAAPKLYVADPATGERLATLPDPNVEAGRWLQESTLAFDRSGEALYGVADFGRPYPADWDDTLVRVSLADGSATTLLDLPTENIARLLVGQVPAPPADIAASPGDPPPTATPAGGIPERLYIVSGADLTARSSLSAIDSQSQQTAYTLENVSTATLSADGTRLYVASDSQSISAHDAASGAELWSTPTRNVVTYRGGGPPVLLLAPDGRTLYVHSAQIDAAFTEGTFWLQMVDPATGILSTQTIPLPSTTTPLPAHGGWGGRLFVAADGATLYHVRDRTVRFVNLRTGAEEAAIIHQAGIFKDAALSPDGGTLYVVDDDCTIHLIDTASRTTRQRVPTKIDPTTHPTTMLTLSADGTYLVIGAIHQDQTGTDSMTRLAGFDTRSWNNVLTMSTRVVAGGTLASSWRGNTIYSVTRLGDVASVWRYDLETNNALAPIALPAAYVRDLLVGPAIYPIAAAEPVPSPAPTDAPVATTKPSLPDPGPQGGMAAWILNNQHLRTWDRNGVPVELEFAADQTVLGVIGRGPEPPLVVVALADGKTGVLEPYTGKLATLEVPITDVEFPVILSPDRTTVAFKSHTQGQENAQFRLADLETGATWTLLDDQPAVTDFFMTDATLLGWDDDILFETHRSATYTLWRSAARPNNPAAPQPRPAEIKTLGNGGIMQINPNAGVLAYVENGGDGLHLLDLATGEDRLVAPDVRTFALSTSGPIAWLVYFRQTRASGYELVFHNPSGGAETVLETGTNSITARLDFVRQGQYLVMQVGAPTAAVLVVATGANPRPLTKITPDQAMSAVGVTNYGELITLGAVDGQQRLTLYPAGRSGSTVMQLGPLSDQVEPARLVYVP